MIQLPFADNGLTWPSVLEFSITAPPRAIKQAIGEAHRVLIRGERLLVVLRTTDDYRFGEGDELERNTFRLTIEGHERIRNGATLRR